MNRPLPFEFPVQAVAAVAGVNKNFEAFIDQSKRIARDSGLCWEMELNEKCEAIPEHVWDLRVMTKDGRPKGAVLRLFSECDDAVAKLIERGLLPPGKKISPVSLAWQDLIKAFSVEHVLVKKKGVGYISQAASALRFLATVSGKAPWLVTADDVRLTCEISDECQVSKGRTVVLLGLLTSLIDPLHLFDACPMGTLVSRPEKATKVRARFAQNEAELKTTLSERKSEEKLPERKAFWELIRIVFTEQPRNLSDALRFAMVKVLLITGLRIGEVSLLPLDWKRTRAYVDDAGRPASEVGGISETLSLRHFAEKQGTNLLYEETQFVPDMFRDVLESNLDEVARLTAPLRKTIKAQFETGRILPMYELDQLVDSVEMYGHLTGNPVWAAEPYPEGVQACLDRYAETMDLTELADLKHLQSTSTSLTATISRYFSPERRANGLAPRNIDGTPGPGRGVRGTVLLVSDVEAYLAEHLKTKLSDLAPLTLDNGTTIAPWEMLFLMPKRAVGAGRGQTVLDPSLTYAIGIADEEMLLRCLGADNYKEQSLFSLYGQSGEDRALRLKTHSFRHLQNTELFRLGVADTIITKRFNRRSVTQSYVYDHRSLAEELDEIELPDEWDLLIGANKAATVAKLIMAGRANGPVVKEFKSIQLKEGDVAALRFLAAEADGFHATPYGTCLNSFTVDPCPKHLECFTGCRHLSATNLPEHQENIITLHGRLKTALDHAQAKPEGSIGKANQIAHASVRLAGVEALMATLPGQPVFPTGTDLSTTTNHRRSVLHGA
ncbi:hypothetical protein LNV08_21970 [Paucibacter sp. TC2R-5]|uniref:hypothetical protein n=1 Tax=Paucibacter sp. TC2R-5 TaxID=2893555 RepID=UPI0021E370EF|nr:hypothetical protein [Paucibacter sp. TC2R-5]MCV2361641.1 hypothetical protein [Paucibacter sp. TC2R-5]